MQFEVQSSEIYYSIKVKKKHIPFSAFSCEKILDVLSSPVSPPVLLQLLHPLNNPYE